MKTDDESSTYVQKTKKCEVDGCFELTRERKPYCENHIERTPYVKALLAKMESRAKEDEKIEQEGATEESLTNISAQDILVYLRQRGTRTEESLAREMGISRTTIHNYVLAMQDKNMVIWRLTSRGRREVTLLDKDGKAATPLLEDDEEEEND